VQHNDTIATKIDRDMLHGHTDKVSDLGFALLRIAEGFRGWAHDAERDLATTRNITWKGPRLATATAAAVPTSLSRDQNEFRNHVEETLDDVEDMTYAVEDVHGEDFYDSFDELLEYTPGFDALVTKIDQALPTESGDTALDIIENVMSRWTEYQTSTTQWSTLTSRLTATPRLGARSPDSTSTSIVLPTFPSALEIAAKRNITGDQLHDVRVVIETIQDNDVNALWAEVAAIHDTYDMSEEVHAFVNVIANLGAKAMHEIDAAGSTFRLRTRASLSTHSPAVQGNAKVNYTLGEIFEGLTIACWKLRTDMDNEFLEELRSLQEDVADLDREESASTMDYDDNLIKELYLEFLNETLPVHHVLYNTIERDVLDMGDIVSAAREQSHDADDQVLAHLDEGWKQATQKLLEDTQKFIDASGRLLHDAFKNKRSGLFNGGDETSSAPNTRHAESSDPYEETSKTTNSIIHGINRAWSDVWLNQTEDWPFVISELEKHLQDVTKQLEVADSRGAPVLDKCKNAITQSITKRLESHDPVGHGLVSEVLSDVAQVLVDVDWAQSLAKGKARDIAQLDDSVATWEWKSHRYINDTLYLLKGSSDAITKALHPVSTKTNGTETAKRFNGLLSSMAALL